MLWDSHNPSRKPLHELARQFKILPSAKRVTNGDNRLTHACCNTVHNEEMPSSSWHIDVCDNGSSRGRKDMQRAGHRGS
jgi:hypothetical protein